MRLCAGNLVYSGVFNECSARLAIDAGGDVAFDLDDADVAETIEKEADEDEKTPHKLVAQETRSTGTIAWRVYYRYFAVCTRGFIAGGFRPCSQLRLC